MTLHIRLNQVHQDAADITCKRVITHDRRGLQPFCDQAATGFATVQSQGSARAFPGEVVGRLCQVGKARNKARLARCLGVDHGADRSAVLLARMAQAVGIFVEILIAARSNQPVNKFAVRVLFLMDRPIMQMARRIYMCVSCGRRCTLVGVQQVPHTVALETVARNDLAAPAVAENYLPTRHPI